MAQVDHLDQPEDGRRLGPPPAPPAPPAAPTLSTRFTQVAAAGTGDPAAGARRMEQSIVRVDPRSVLNLSLGFFRRMLLLGLGLGLLFWLGALVTGTASSIDSFIQELSGYPSLTVLGFQGLLVALVLGLTFVVGGALVAVLVVVVFNLASDLGGGVKMTVMETALDDGLVGRDGAGSLVEHEHSGPRPLVGTRRRRPVLGADVTSLDARADTGPAGADDAGDDRSGHPTVLRGARVVGVEQDSPAHSAGLAAGDVIVSVDGTTVDSPAALSSALNGHDADGAVDMSWVDQQGRYRTAIVRLGDRSG
ncbi:MAG TPA: PDZ domain-containing protein [Actinomycetota bacterium]|nr:PDZ domain-containing protein [Actinomycetota bacterium]